VPHMRSPVVMQILQRLAQNLAQDRSGAIWVTQR
jgi:hypothetical protein